MSARRLGRLGALLVLLPAAAAGCKGHEFHAMSDEERVAEAEAVFTPVLFDTVAWPSDSVRVAAGNEVFAASCRKCHGTVGEGGTAYAAEQDLDVPSLVRRDWSMEGDLGAVRHRIFVGHVEGMPTWGIAGITPREIDAVAAYILYQLRPEMLATDGGGR